MRDPTLSLAATPPRERLRFLRYAWRAPLLFVHVLLALPLALLVASPLPGIAFRNSLIRWWSGRVMRIFGFRIARFGTPLPGAVLYVANHISWLDIVLMLSQRAVSFVAKSEIDRWPLVGWLASCAGTLFHRRGNTASLNQVMARVVERLRGGVPVGVFPEGGSGHGQRVGTFHARIFQTALDANVPVQPVALRYGNGGRQDPRVPFAAGEKFMPNLLRLLGGPPMDAEVHFLEAVEPTPEARRHMAEESRARIVATLGYGDE